MNSAAYPPVTMRVCITALHVADEAVHQGRGAEIGAEYCRDGGKVEDPYAAAFRLLL